MPERSGQGLAGPAGDEARFDAESARRILERAAAEQQRMTNELADTYSFKELQEIAAEAEISPEALRAAVEADESHSAPAAAGRPVAPDAQPRRPAARGWKPGQWSRGSKAVVLTTAGGIAFFGSLLAFPEVAGAVFWALLLVLIVVSVLLVLGASPF